jgi:MFS family permease
MESLSIAQSRPENEIQWKQLWSLAALYGSVVIGWIAYQNYQPRLLVEFQFTDFTFLLMVAQGVILVVTPPLAGRLGDRFRFRQGHRMPVITAGISFAAMIFMAVAFTLFSHPGEIFRWVLPVLIVFWLVAMSIFTSPALSTMELFMPVDKLPRAMAVLTIVANLIYSLEPIVVDIIDFLGAPLTFITGGVVVLLSGYALKTTSLGLFKSNGNKETTRPVASFTRDTKKSQRGMIFLFGGGLGLATTILFNVFPQVLHGKLSAFINVDGKIMIVGILLVSALLSMPVSRWVNILGLEKSFRISLLMSIVSMAGVIFFGSVWMVIPMVLLFAISFTFLSISALPLAMEKSAYYEKVFCVGIFFSGVALPGGIVEALQVFN